MTTEEKLQLIVDKLLVKTQDNLCDWKKDGNKYRLRMPAYADITIYLDGINDSWNINLDVIRGDLVLASVRKDTDETEAALVRLFEYVKSYHENYINEQLEKLMGEVDKLNKEK
jgi:hypothetical protein